jgi:hypothetical protein
LLGDWLPDDCGTTCFASSGGWSGLMWMRLKG